MTTIARPPTTSRASASRAAPTPVTPTDNVRYAHDRIVIGIPTYNEERFIAESLRSLQSQSHRDFLVLISDNASTDATPDICRELCQQDQRFHFVQQPRNIGSADNCNFLLNRTDSPYFMWFGAHDLLHPDFLKHHLSALDAAPRSALSCSTTQWIDEAGRPTKITNASRLYTIYGFKWRRYLACVRMIGECTAVNQVMRRSALRGFVFERVRSADHILMARMLYFGPVCFTPRPLYLRRYFASRPNAFEDYMERITASRPHSADRRPMFDAHARGLQSLPARRLEKAIMKPVLRATLHYRFSGGLWRVMRRTRARLAGRTPQPGAVPR